MVITDRHWIQIDCDIILYFKKFQFCQFCFDQRFFRKNAALIWRLSKTPNILCIYYKDFNFHKHLISTFKRLHFAQILGFDKKQFVSFTNNCLFLIPLSLSHFEYLQGAVIRYRPNSSVVPYFSENLPLHLINNPSLYRFLL